MFVVWALPACSGPRDDDDFSGDCDKADVFSATSCDEQYCGPAVARLGGGVGDYVPMEDGDTVMVVYGSQGGYHIDVTVEMDNFCPIVFIRPSMWLDRGDGSDLISIFDQSRHVQAVRVEPFDSPLQQFWGLRAVVPCENWPDDPEHPIECGGGRGTDGFIEDFEVELRLEVEDHNGRIANDSKRVQPSCCD